MNNSMYLIFTLVGVVAGAICGALIGKNNVYRSLDKHNSLSNFISPELLERKYVDKTGLLVVIFVGTFFLIGGCIAEGVVYSETAGKLSKMTSEMGTLVVFGIICLIFSLALIISSVIKLVKAGK